MGTCQTVTLPWYGSYKFECWGASGGADPNPSGTASPGRGGYCSGTATFIIGTQFYIYVGEQGKNTYRGTVQGGTGNQPNAGGWNGGGCGGNNVGSTIASGGGGATDIRLNAHGHANGWGGLASLRSRIMVAGGGGGCSSTNGANSGGAGGGLTGQSGLPSSAYSDASLENKGGGQTSTGSCAFYVNNSNAQARAIIEDPNTLCPYGTFGYADQDGENVWFGGGGGGGWYGGVQGWGRGGSGGSSFISGHSGCRAVNQSSSTSTATVHKSGTYAERYDNTYYFTSTSMTQGATNSPGGHNGYAKITSL